MSSGLVVALGVIAATASAGAVHSGALPSSSASAPQAPAPLAEVLSGSEISVIESGGFAGRVHAVRLVATDGRVDVEYRAPEVAPSALPFTGTLETDRYVALWRELETARIWELVARAPAKGADLVQVEVRVRLGDSGRVVRWDEGSAQSAEIRALVETARRVLAAGRGSAFTR